MQAWTSLHPLIAGLEAVDGQNRRGDHHHELRTPLQVVVAVRVLKASACPNSRRSKNRVTHGNPNMAQALVSGKNGPKPAVGWLFFDPPPHTELSALRPGIVGPLQVEILAALQVLDVCLRDSANGRGSKAKSVSPPTNMHEHQPIQPLKLVVNWVVNSPTPEWDPIGFDTRQNVPKGAVEREPDTNAPGR